MRHAWICVVVALLLPALVSCGGDPMDVDEDTCSRSYPLTQLEGWYARTDPILAMEGVTMRDLDEAKGCIMFGISGWSVRPAIIAKLDDLQIPRDAVYIQIVVGGLRAQ